MKADFAKMVARLDSILNPPSRLGPPRPRRHQRKCAICRHPERHAIEQDPIQEMVEIYRINDRSTIYRHANAQGLFERRRHYIRFALDPIIEQAASVRVSSASIVNAVRTYAQMNDAGDWIGPDPALPATECPPPAGQTTQETCNL